MYDVFLILLIFSNIVCLAYLLRLKLKKPPPIPEVKAPMAIDATQLIHDLTKTGGAVVRIVPLDPSGIFYRSPRG